MSAIILSPSLCSRRMMLVTNIDGQLVYFPAWLSGHVGDCLYSIAQRRAFQLGTQHLLDRHVIEHSLVFLVAFYKYDQLAFWRIGGFIVIA